MNGKICELNSLRGKLVLLNFWRTASAACREQLQSLSKSHDVLRSRGVEVLALNFDDPQDPQTVKALSSKEGIPFRLLLATPEIAGIYNIVYRYLFDRHRDLSFPTSLLLDPSASIIKIYQGTLDPNLLAQDAVSLPNHSSDRIAKALPFPGTLLQGDFQRNSLSYGVALFQHGYLHQAELAFQQVIAAKPEEVEAYYNLGTLYLRQKAQQPAKENLEHALQLRPNYPEAWNNLGMLAAQAGNNEEAIRNFQRSIELRPRYSTALLNLGNLYRQLGNFAEAESLLKRAYDSEPANPEANYSLGMLYARRNDSAHAEQYLTNAIKLRPDYSDALNNLGVLLIQQHRYPEAEAHLEDCITKAPAFDQAYLNLARLYVVLNDKAKAKTVLQALLQKQPDHKMAQQMLQLLY